MSTSEQLPDEERRYQGAFFTPAPWVGEVHRVLDGVLGPTWRNDCVVWDPACGSGNLTRGYTFSDLLCSTLESMDLRGVENPGAQVFKLDFLNDAVPDTVQAHLRAAAKSGKPLVFLMNPPYGTASVAGANSESKAGIAKTNVKSEMGLGRASNQLYAQFMYQCYTLAQQYGFKQHVVALLSQPGFITSGSFKPFRKWWYGRHAVKSAFMFQASHFADVSGRWGVSFTVWASPGITPTDSRIVCMLKDVVDGAIVDIGEKALYNADNREASRWVREHKPFKGSPAYEQWVDDANIYAILHNSNNCTAMRDVTYKNKLWTIHNHFFWRTHASALAALNTPRTSNIYQDCLDHPAKDVFGQPVESTPDPYMASQIPKLNLSPEAQAVLTKLDALWLKSLPMRESYAACKPELHLTAWDCGVYQLKHLWRTLYSEEWEDLLAAFKVLVDKLRPGVYDHGFLLR